MNSPLFTDNLTVYNRYRQGGEERWKRTILKGVQWTQKVVRTASNSGSVVITTETHVTIPAWVSGGTYVNSLSFADAEDKSSLWTLAPGDLIMLGVCTLEVTGAVTSDSLCKMGAAVIRSAKDNTLRPRLKQWKVVAI